MYFIRAKAQIERFFKFLIVSVMVFVCVFPLYGTRKKKILVLHSYHQGLEWTDNITKGIQSVLKPLSNSIEVYFEYLDTKRNVGELYYRKLVEYHETKMKNNIFDVIIVADNNGLQFIKEYGHSLYANIPVVFCGINNFRPGLVAGINNITGVIETLDHQSTLRLMLKLHPDVERILVFGDKTVTGLEEYQTFRDVAHLFEDRVVFEYYQDYLLEEIEQKVAGLGDQYLIYMLTISRDRDNKYISYREGIEMLSRASHVPIYGSWDFYMGSGLLGGKITSGKLQGQKAAQFAVRILNGEEANDIPILYDSPAQYIFDYNQMERFDIHQSQLPKGTLVINRPPGFFQRYQTLLLAFLVVSSISVVFLLLNSYFQRRKQKFLTQHNRRLDQQVAEKTAELRQALENIKTLKGLIPICTKCKKIRDDKGYWNQIEDYIAQHTDAAFSHGLCSKCEEDIYSKEEWYKDWKDGK